MVNYLLYKFQINKQKRLLKYIKFYLQLKQNSIHKYYQCERSYITYLSEVCLVDVAEKGREVLESLYNFISLRKYWSTYFVKD